MKKLRTHIEQYFNRLDDRFRDLPLRKQRQFTLYCFLGYFLLTVFVIWGVWFDVVTSNNVVYIKPFEKPVIKKKERKKERKSSSVAGQLIHDFKERNL